jgi:adenylate kinase family enzyme
MTDAIRIYITGASCAGVTTLGQRLAQRLGIPHADVDDFYWLPTDPPYSRKRPPLERIPLIAGALGAGDWVLTGSFDGWGDPLIETAGLIVFVTTPTPVRMARLMERERQRHGERIRPGGDMHEIHTAFADWASRYDEPEFSGRNRARHEAWLAQQSTPVLRVDGSRPVEELIETVLRAV